MAEKNTALAPKVRTYICLAVAIFGAGVGWYYMTPEHPFQGLFWGSILGAFAAHIVLSIVED